MVNSWEYSYNGLTFGGNTSYGVQEVTGLASPPEIRADLNDKVGRHGMYTYMDRYEARRITITGDIADQSTQANFEAKVVAIKTAFVGRVNDSPFVFARPGLGGSGQHRVFAKPSRVEVPLDTAYAIGYGAWAVELIAGDPFIYDDSATTVAITGGAGTVSANNQGNIATLFEQVRVTGPYTGYVTLRINGDTNNSLKIAYAVTAGNYIDVNFKERTIVDNGGTSRYGSIDQSVSKWWELPVGSTTLQAQFGGGTSGATRVDWTFRSAWT